MFTGHCLSIEGVVMYTFSLLSDILKSIIERLTSIDKLPIEKLLVVDAISVGKGSYDSVVE